jgi:hypothetical protein
MAGIFQGDIFIKAAIENGMDDMRKNPWLIDHMLGDLASNPYTAAKYGQKQIDACKEWFLNNKINVFMRGRDDKDELPCITIEIGSSNEKEPMKSMGDSSSETVVLMPQEIGKPIPFVVKPFDTSYENSTGHVPVPSGLDSVAIGMILVDPSTGHGYQIIGMDDEGVFIEEDLELDTTRFAIIPQFQFYKARVEHTFFQETYNVGCHVHGDPQVLLWLESIVLYSILRYRESLLEANGFAESVVSRGNPDLNGNFATEGGETAWSRYITLSGQVENTWIKSPRRVIEKATVKDGMTGGITIMSNLDSTFDATQEAWTTINDPGTDEEQG